MFNLKTKPLGIYDVIVCGGGVAGIGAAVTAARNGASVVLIEKSAALGGTLTEGLMPNIMDGDNKGGLIRELFHFLNEHGMTCTRRGERVDKNGKLIPGRMIDMEGAKYFFEKVCVEAGVKVLYNCMLAGVDHTEGHINEIFVSSLCGNYTLGASLYIDATGYGMLSELADLTWDCGLPEDKSTNPASMSIMLGGLPRDYNGTDSPKEKTEYAKLLAQNGIHISAEQASLAKLPSLETWSAGFNFEYNVRPDDIEVLSDAIISGRKEAFEFVEGHKKIKGYERVYNAGSASYFGVREGRRVKGLYRISTEDIIEGKRFEDGICLVTTGVDVHKLNSRDTTDCQRGIRSKAYHIPYRALLPQGTDNMLLAGRCISGDFYPFSSYRMMGNMMTVGEAAGYAAAICAKKKIKPSEVEGKYVNKYMKSIGHQL